MPLPDLTPVPVRMAPPIACAIRPVAVPREPEWSATPTVTVRGRRVTVRPNAGYAYVQGVKVGGDGSLLITRRTSSEMYSIHDFVRVGERETLVAFEDHPASVVAYRDGRAAKVGLGSPVKVFGLDDLLLSIPVDEKGQPSGLEMTVGQRLALHRRGRVVELGDFRFEASLPGGGLVLSRGDELREWRDGGFVSARLLPSGWRVNAANARGDLLLRHPTPFRTRNGGIETGEEDWSMALLRGATLAPLRFARPRGSERLLWREPATLSPDRRVRFTAFYGDDERGYEVRPKRRQFSLLQTTRQRSGKR